MLYYITFWKTLFVNNCAICKHTCLFCSLCLGELQYYLRVYSEGRAINQAVSLHLPNAVARFRSQVRSFELCGGKSGTGQVFSEYTKHLP
jgi:hypothetical protein